jgi:hypothetical protein
MNRRMTIIVALAALVTGTLVIVYACQGALTPTVRGAVDNHSAAREARVAEAEPKTETEVPKQSEPAKQPEPPKATVTPAPQTEPAPQTVPTPKATGTPAPQVIYNPASLPAPVKQMLEQIFETAQDGDIEAMRPVLESNELKPMVSTGSAVEDPIAFWKKNSADGEGREVLAAMLNILSSGFVKVGQGNDAMYVWPYFAEMDLTTLTPAQDVELYRIVPPAQALAMKKSGKYSYYRLGVSPIGVWHYFLQ